SRREVLIPVDQQVRELVRAEQDRRHGESDAEEPERLEYRVIAAGRGRYRRRRHGACRTDRAGNSCSHWLPPWPLTDSIRYVRRSGIFRPTWHPIEIVPRIGPG